MSRDNRTPLNADGDFYVVKDLCLLCTAPYEEARELMEIDFRGDGCYFKRQPSNTDEVEKAVRAVSVSCIEALRYAGSDPEIIRKLRERGCASQIDLVEPNNESPNSTETSSD